MLKTINIIRIEKIMLINKNIEFEFKKKKKKIKMIYNLKGSNVKNILKFFYQLISKKKM